MEPIKYYPITKKWHKIRPLINTDEIQSVLVRDFNKYTYGRWHKQFKRGMVPAEFEGCDWHCERRGRRPEYWDYVKHAACHWLVNFNLKLAMTVEPKKNWRILTSEKHSTVWDGESTLFDMNFSALLVPPQEAFDLAFDRELKTGKQLIVHYAEYC